MHIHCIYVYIQCIYMYIHSTWVPHIVCIYHYCVCHSMLVYTMLSYRNLPLCTYRDIPPLYPLRMAVKTTGENMHIHCICVHTVYIHVQTLYMGTIYCMHIPLLCLPQHACIYNVIIQESTIVYIQGYTSSIPPKNGC